MKSAYLCLVSAFLFTTSAAASDVASIGPVKIGMTPDQVLISLAELMPGAKYGQKIIKNAELGGDHTFSILAEKRDDRHKRHVFEGIFSANSSGNQILSMGMGIVYNKDKGPYFDDLRKTVFEKYGKPDLITVEKNTTTGSSFEFFYYIGGGNPYKSGGDYSPCIANLDQLYYKRDKYIKECGITVHVYATSYNDKNLVDEFRIGVVDHIKGNQLYEKEYQYIEAFRAGEIEKGKNSNNPTPTF